MKDFHCQVNKELLMSDYSIPSSLAHPISVDKKYREHDSGIRDDKEYCVCKSCKGRAVKDSFDSTDKDGHRKTVQVTRCVEKVKCPAYREDNPETGEVSKVSDEVVFYYLKLHKDHKEQVAKACGLSYRNVGYSMRKSGTRMLLESELCAKLSSLVFEKYLEVKKELETNKNSSYQKFYDGVNMQSTIQDEADKIKVQTLAKASNTTFINQEKVGFNFTVLNKDEADLMVKALEFFSNHYERNSLKDTRDGKAIFSVASRFFKEAKQYYSK